MEKAKCRYTSMVCPMTLRRLHPATDIFLPEVALTERSGELRYRLKNHAIKAQQDASQMRVAFSNINVAAWPISRASLSTLRRLLARPRNNSAGLSKDIYLPGSLGISSA